MKHTFQRHVGFFCPRCNCIQRMQTHLSNTPLALQLCRVFATLLSQFQLCVRCFNSDLLSFHMVICCIQVCHAGFQNMTMMCKLFECIFIIQKNTPVPMNKFIDFWCADRMNFRRKLRETQWFYFCADAAKPRMQSRELTEQCRKRRGWTSRNDCYRRSIHCTRMPVACVELRIHDKSLLAASVKSIFPDHDFCAALSYSSYTTPPTFGYRPGRRLWDRSRGSCEPW